MSYFRSSFGDDPWASAGGVPVTTAPTTAGASQAAGGALSSITGALSNLFGTASSAAATVAKPGEPPKPSTVTQVGSGIANFLNLIKPTVPVVAASPYPIAPSGPSATTKIALLGGAAVIAAVLLARR